MKKICTLLCVFALFLPIAAKAKPNADEFELMKQAIEHSAQADVYNAHCDKNSTLADDFIQKFENKRGITDTQKSRLTAIKQQNVAMAQKVIEGASEGCKSLDFMMKRIDVMRKLKDVSYLLNGVDPATLPPDNIPNLEDLLPPRSKTNFPDPNIQMEDL